MNRTETAEMIAVMAEAYRSTWRKSESRGEVEKQVNIWMRYTEDIGYQEGMAALDRLISERVSAFAPTIGEIRRSVMQARNPALLISGEDAWTEAWQAVKDVGHHSTPEWSHPALAMAVEAFGWKELCLTELANLGTVRSQFMRIYEAKRSMEETRAATPDRVRIEPPARADKRIIEGQNRRLGISGPAREALPAPEEGEMTEEGRKNGMAMIMSAIQKIGSSKSQEVALPSKQFHMTDEDRTSPDYLPGVDRAE